MISHWDDARTWRGERGHIAGTWSSLTGRNSRTVGLKRIQIDPDMWSTPLHLEGHDEEIFWVLGGSGVSVQWEGEDTLAEQARNALADLLRRMGFACEVDVDLGEESPVLHIRGDNTSVLIGKHGQTLDALEYVLNRMIARDEETLTRVHLDCEHYREKRRHSLEEMALRMAEQVRKRGRAVTLDPLSPRDRRTVHLALQNEPDVTTRSTGEGSYRQLQILPQRSGGGSRGG